MNRKRFLGVLAGALLLAAPSTSTATPFAVWLDGNTTPGGGGQGILTSLDNAFGSGSYTLVTTADLATPGFLTPFSTLIVSRFDSSFGSTTFGSALADANVMAYVGAGPTQGGVALFTNDASDNFFGSTSGDPYDPNLDRLFTNAATFASASGHGYIGEFNGAVIGINELHLLPGVAGSLHFVSPPFVYLVGPIGSGNPIDAGVTFPFTDTDSSTFRTDITGASSSNIVDVYADNGSPAVLANSAAGAGGGPPVPEPASLVLLGTGLIAAARRRRSVKN